MDDKYDLDLFDESKSQRSRRKKSPQPTPSASGKRPLGANTRRVGGRRSDDSNKRRKKRKNRSRIIIIIIGIIIIAAFVFLLIFAFKGNSAFDSEDTREISTETISVSDTESAVSAEAAAPPQ